MRRWNERTEIPAGRFVGWLGIRPASSTTGKAATASVNEHNAWIPRDWWLEDWEKQAIIRFSFEYPLEGYRRLAFMMLDRDVAAASPSSVYRVLKAAGRIGRSTNKPSKKGTGFHQPQKPHEHWHIDISYINIHGTFYYLTTILDGYSRYIVHWEIRRSMTEQDELVVLQRAKEKFPHETPRIISDNGSQFLAKDFKEFIRICGMTHVRTSPTIRRATANWSGSTAASRASASGPARRSRWKTPCGSWAGTWSTTTRSACTAPSATSRRRTSWRAARRKSSPPATASWPRREKGGRAQREAARLQAVA